MRGILSAIEASRPRSMDDLLDHIANTRAPRLIAGGTDVMVQLEAGGQEEGESFLDLTALASDLRYHRLDEDSLEIGALATFRDTRQRNDIVAAFPLLEASARTIGATQIQTRGTWAGNIANGSPAADGVAALLAYDAEVVLMSRQGRRTTPLCGFFSGYKKMDIGPGEFLAAIRLPRAKPDRLQEFWKVGTRRAQAITKVGLTINWRADGSWRIVGTSLAPFVTRYDGLERLFGQFGDHPGRLDADQQAAAVATAVQADLKPIDDIRSTADYRRRVVINLLCDAASRLHQT
ncbi:MAG: FAD binding domain-containing protein [Candidatus Eisenbacteria bacterium]|nr:FAD binding domain-containing protein [Candidatus Eisenbacteria bacterium]